MMVPSGGWWDVRRSQPMKLIELCQKFLVHSLRCGHAPLSSTVDRLPSYATTTLRLAPLLALPCHAIPLTKSITGLLREEQMFLKHGRKDTDMT